MVREVKIIINYFSVVISRIKFIFDFGSSELPKQRKEFSSKNINVTFTVIRCHDSLYKSYTESMDPVNYKDFCRLSPVKVVSPPFKH